VPHGRVAASRSASASLQACATGTQCRGGVDVNKPRIRAALAAVLALAVAPDGFTVAQFTTKVAAMTGQTDAD
jgi:hypothetical protein